MALQKEIKQPLHPVNAGFTFWGSVSSASQPLLTCSEFWLTGQTLMLSSRQNEKFCL